MRRLGKIPEGATVFPSAAKAAPVCKWFTYDLKVVPFKALSFSAGCSARSCGRRGFWKKCELSELSE